MNFCISSLVPSLFPYMILSGVLSTSIHINKAFSVIFQRFFSFLGVCRKYTYIIIWGNISGFVVGPKLLSEETSLSLNKSYTRLTLISSNAGLGFVVSFVGQTMLGSPLFGLTLYLSQVFISIFLNSFLLFKKETDNTQSIDFKRKPLIQSITNSVSSTSSALISICAYTVVFSTLSSLIIKFLNLVDKPILSTIIYSLFDVTKGIKSALMIKNSYFSFFFIGFSVGFGGISILLQIFSICESLKINKLKFFVSKFLQGILCGVLSLILSLFFKFESKNLPAFNIFDNKSIFATILFCFLFIFIVKKYIKIKILLNCVEFLKKIIYNIKIKYFLGGIYGRK